MKDFWRQFDGSYRLFSQFCSSDDWCIILTAIANLVVRHAKQSDCQISILDVGCGTGVATQTICERIFAQTGCFPTLSVVEPSEVARERLRSNILSESEGGPLKRVVESPEQLPAELKVDVILLLHSTYYIQDFGKMLTDVLACHLRPSGMICTLVLPEESPFFLGLPPLPNCSDQVEAVFRSANFDVESFVLQSRFLLPQAGFSEDELKRLRPFFMHDKGSPLDLRTLFDEYKSSSSNIDFQDHLLAARSRGRCGGQGD